MIKTGKKKSSKNRLIAQLDKIAQQRIHDRDESTCQRCGSKDYPQWSHIFTRGYHITRWDDDNAVIHCRDCHCWFTNHHTRGIVWFEEKFPDRWERLKLIQRKGGKVTTSDLRAMLERLARARRNDPESNQTGIYRSPEDRTSKGA